MVRTGLPGSVTGPLRARLLAGGRSNLTYEVSDGTCSWMVRLLLGHVQATAYDMGREYRVITTGSLDAPGSGNARGWHPPLPVARPCQRVLPGADSRWLSTKWATWWPSR